MFFSQDLLQKRGGKFGLIWIAATKDRSKSLSKREYYAVNVGNTCQDIIKYICNRAEPLTSGGSRPRLSLHLSSYLMYGIVKVYHQQQKYMLVELRQLLRSVRMQNTKNIDLPDPIQEPPSDVALLEALFTRNTVLGERHDSTLSTIPDYEILVMPSPRLSSPQLNILSDSELRKSFETSHRPETGLPLQSSPDKITLREEPASTDHLINQGKDLEFDPNFLDLLKGNVLPDDLFFTDVEPQRPIEETSLLDNQNATSDPLATVTMQGELEQTPLPSTDAAQLNRLHEQAVRSPDITVLGPTGAPDVTSKPAARRLHLDTSAADAIPEEAPAKTDSRRRQTEPLELDSQLDAPATKRRRRQAPFADSDIQLDRERVKKQIANGSLTTNPAQFAPPPAKRLNKFLNPLTRPCLSILMAPCAPRLLWKRNLVSSTTRGVVDHSKDPSWTVPHLFMDGSSVTETDSGSGSGKEVRLPSHQQLPVASPIAAVDDSLLTRREEVLSAEAEQLRRIIEDSLIQQDIEPERADRSLERGRTDEDPSLGDSRLGVQDESIPLQRKRERSSGSRGDTSDISVDESMRKRRSSRKTGLMNASIESLVGDMSVTGVCPMPDIQETLEQQPWGDDPVTVPRTSLPYWTQLEERLNSPHQVNFIKSVEEGTGSGNEVTFSTICPPGRVSRAEAARAFAALLDNCAFAKLAARQYEPLGEIYISRAAHF